MFNTYNKFNYNINAVSGTLRKSHPKSKMIIRKLSICDKVYVFDETKPRLSCGSEKEIVVLQVMLVGDNKAVIEYVNKEDFEGEVESNG